MSSYPGAQSDGRNVPFTHDVPLAFVPPAGRGDGSVVVALHGMGQSATSFARDVLPLLPDDAAGIVPQAPFPYEMRSPEGGGPPRAGNAWYVYTGDGPAFLAAMERTEAWLLAVIEDEVRRRGLDRTRVALLGYSQGGYLAGFVGLRHASRFRALVVAAGRIKDESVGDALAAARGLPVLHVHGAEDTSVAPAAAEASCGRIAARGVAATFRSFPCGHPVLRDEACREAVRTFLVEALSTAPRGRDPVSVPGFLG